MTLRTLLGSPWVPFGAALGVLVAAALGALFAIRQRAARRPDAKGLGQLPSRAGTLGQPDGALAARLLELVDSLQYGFVAMDRELHYTHVNPAAERLLGMPARQLVGRALLEAFPEVDGIEFHAACLRVLRDRIAEHVDQFFPPHGRWYRNHFYPTTEGLAVVFEDITLARRTEAQLAEERLRYLALFHQTGAGIVECRLDDGRLISANERFAQLLGRQPAQLVGREMDALVHPDDRADAQAGFERLQRGAVRELAFEKRCLRPDGSVVWVSITSSVVRADGERAPYVISIFQDVTERRRAVEALARSEQRLEVYSRELARAVENERARIAREIHDELGQALTGLKLDVAWVARRLAARPPGALAGPVAERLEDIQLRLDETVRSMRRIATELRPAALDELGLGAALRAHVAEFAHRAGLEAEVHVEDVPAGGDGATALFRIAQEALTNVARHAGARRVSVHLRVHGTDAVLEVSDDGTGTVPDLETPGQARAGGHGLVGIYERARLAGGNARITSRPGQGTTVHARVPCRTPPPPAAEDRS